MDAFRLNYFIRFRQVHSNNRWHKFNCSIRKLFGCMDHNLAWLYFSANDVFGGSAYVIHWDSFKNIVPANSWKINLDRNWAPIPSLHKTTLVNDLPHSTSTVSVTFFWQLIDVILLWPDVLVYFNPYLAYCKFKIRERKALISKVVALDFILLIISNSSQRNRHELANHHRIFQIYVCYKHDYEPF